ncbi:MAG: glycosyltransferase [Opitutaceae bacterium]
MAKFGPELAQALARSNLSVRWIIADDGSTSAELERLKNLLEDFRNVYSATELFECTQRFRKGGAIYQAWNQDETVGGYAFVDADGAIDANTVVELLKAFSGDSSSAYVGVRKQSEATKVTRPLGRSLSFKLFTGLVRLMTGYPFGDTQCGLKVIPGAAYRTISDRLIERGFVFDVELLVALKERSISIVERPISWQEMPDGKINPLKDAWAMIGGLMRIRKRIRSGDYSPSD